MAPQIQELVAARLAGTELSAAGGVRVFVPLFGANFTAHTGYLQLSP